MLPYAIKPLEEAWRPLLDAVSGRKVEPRALALMVSRLSARYRGEDVTVAPNDALIARARFWFPRDVVKVALPFGELVYAGALPARPLRVLDLGAGLGATSLGLVRALPKEHTIAHVTAIDRDGDALATLRRIAEGAAERGLLAPVASLVTETRDVTTHGWSAGLGEFDLVTAGLALVEMTRSLGDETARGEALAAHMREALACVRDDGALVVIEPAMREETRALHRARDVLVREGVTVFAPCLHTRECPMLANERDWCHEDVTGVSLPEWLVPIAREAGLRYEGPTFAYLVLRKDGRTLRDAVAGGGLPVRLVSRPLETKGKTEATVCGDLPGPSTGARAMELRRDAKGSSAPTLESRERGDVVVLPSDTQAEAGRVRLFPGRWKPAEDPHG
jgi:SAM-dependent methyltransferase